MSKIRWLHVSDLHLNSDGTETIRLREELPHYLKKKGLFCNYVFCTGDIRYAPLGAYPVNSADYLKTLCSSVGVDTNRLFIVPGNHDVNRNLSSRDSAVKRIRFNHDREHLGYYKSSDGKIKDNDLRALHEGQKEFRDFLSEIYDAERMGFYNNPYKPHFVVETDDFNILHVDSTVSYTEFQEQSLVLGTKYLQNALLGINKSKPTILLTHYAFWSLSQDEKNEVSELLYENNVQLWLAGHEHEHNLTPFKYIHSIQSGELRLEQDCRTSVLLGEYDNETGLVTIRAYAWFKEGWAEYPILWHNDGDESKYTFQLKNSARVLGKVFSAENSLNSFIKNNHYDVDVKLFPNIMCEGVEFQNKNCNPLIGLLNEQWKSNNSILLLGEGGMGKSTMLTFACKQLLEEGKLAIYVPLEQISSLGGRIEEFVSQTLFGERYSEKLFSLIECAYSIPSLYLFLDGLNEVESSYESIIVKDIKKLISYCGVQVVVSSRNDIVYRYNMQHFATAKISNLSEDQIKLLFNDEEWLYLKENYSLVRLFGNPMMITLYKNIYPIQKEFSDKNYLKWKIVKNETQLLYNYYTAQLALQIHSFGVDPKKILISYLCLYKYLPYIAYRLESVEKYHVSCDDFNEFICLAIKEVKIEDKYFRDIQREFRISEIPRFSELEIYDYIVNVTHFVNIYNNAVTFPHQIFRDFLSAFYIFSTELNDVIVEAVWNKRAFPYVISNHIRVLSDNYWGDGGFARLIAESARNKTDKEKHFQIRNLLNCFPYNCENIPDYSYLDLTNFRIPNIINAKDKISLFKTKLSDFSLGCEHNEIVHYHYLQFDINSSWLFALHKNTFDIFSMSSGEKVCALQIDGKINGLAFSDNYDCILVRHYKSQELLTIICYDGVHWIKTGTLEGIFYPRLRNICLDFDKILHLYYNNREYRCAINDAKIIYNKRSKYSKEKCLEAESLLQKLRTRLPIYRGSEIRCESPDGIFYAISSPNGKLMVYYKGGQIYHKLADGRTVLLDAAISGNGIYAVTLSFNLFDGKRKIQLWDLDRRIKCEERFCSPQTRKLHLTDSGEWIIGEESETNIWCWKWNDVTCKREYNFRFISNQYGKLSSYGNKILRKDARQTVELFDLDNENIIPVVNPCKNIRLATLMPNGSIATVGKDFKKAQFYSINRSSGVATNELLSVNSEDSTIVGLIGVRSQPFLAVATANNIVSMYHTELGGRKRILHSNGNRLIASHQDKIAIACTDGKDCFVVYHYYEWHAGEKRCGNWKSVKSNIKINGYILDIAFNAKNEKQVTITSNGEILYTQDLDCEFHSMTQVITGVNLDAYNFKDAVCDNELKKQLIANGCNLG